MRLAVEHNLHQTKHAERPGPGRTSDLNAVPDLERADSRGAGCAWREIHDAKVELPLLFTRWAQAQCLGGWPPLP